MCMQKTPQQRKKRRTNFVTKVQACPPFIVSRIARASTDGHGVEAKTWKTETWRGRKKNSVRRANNTSWKRSTQTAAVHRLTHESLPHSAGPNVLVLVVDRAGRRIEFGKSHAHLRDVGPEAAVPHQHLQVHLRRGGECECMRVFVLGNSGKALLKKQNFRTARTSTLIGREGGNVLGVSVGYVLHYSKYVLGGTATIRTG